MKLKRFFIERNSAKNTRDGYNASVKHFEKITNKNIDDCIDIAKSENKLEWTETQLYYWLIEFRNYCYDNFKESAARTHITRIKSLFHHYNTYIGDLPYFSTKQVMKSDEIDYEDLPNREILKRCIEVKNPLLKALTLFMSSTGIARTDTHNMTIQNYLDATYEYHHKDNIYDAIEIMDKSEISVIPTFKLHRKKTGETYRTFASPESVKAINMYLLTRENITNEDKLFKINFTYFNTIFKETNDMLGLGQINGRSRFSPQMLRSYHASQLAEAGMNDANIDLLQGRKPQSIARKSYIRVKRSKLKEEYIRCLPFLVVEDIEEVRTELDVTKSKLEEKTTEYNNLHESIMNIQEEMNNMKKRQDIWEKLQGDNNE